MKLGLLNVIVYVTRTYEIMGIYPPRNTDAIGALQQIALYCSCPLIMIRIFTVDSRRARKMKPIRAGIAQM